MALYDPHSLALLKDKVDLIEVLSSHIKMQRAGSYYKGLCPFHEEKTPSFVVQPGDSHYHCFGCGAHGDAITFLMSHQKIGFKEAVESLAERFQVPLERAEEDKTGSSKRALRDVLQSAMEFYHFCLLHTEEGHAALSYLYQRGIDLPFIQQFKLGFSPKGDLLKKYLLAGGVDEKLLLEAGLISEQSRRDFFHERVMVPIHDSMGYVIGFSARKIQESTFGGKYINTQETTLFKKSHVLFGLHYGRTKIAKEKKAIIVEGQIDALRLIYEGFDYTVAGQGTAFGEGHAKELMHLGVEQVILALDADEAGKTAALKVGHLFQKKGIDVRVILFDSGEDPDLYLREKGKEAFIKKIEEAQPYLLFAWNRLAHNHDLTIPTQKNLVVQEMVKRIRDFESPILVYESLKKLSTIADVPESLLGIGNRPPTILKKLERLEIDGDRIIEVDVLRWYLIALQLEKDLLSLIEKNISKEDFKNPLCQALFEKLQEEKKRAFDMMQFGSKLKEEELTLLEEMTQKRINRLKAKEGVMESLQKLHHRNWMQEREKLRQSIELSSEEEQLALSEKLSHLIKNPPSLHA